MGCVDQEHQVKEEKREAAMHEQNQDARSKEMMNQFMRCLRRIIYEARELVGLRGSLLLAVLALVAVHSGSAFAQQPDAAGGDARLIDELDAAGAKVQEARYRPSRSYSR